jgi:hypothetical protein
MDLLDEPPSFELTTRAFWPCFPSPPRRAPGSRSSTRALRARARGAARAAGEESRGLPRLPAAARAAPCRSASSAPIAATGCAAGDGRRASRRRREAGRPRGVRVTGLFGGAFDPPHNGHVRSRRDCARALRLERLAVSWSSIPGTADVVLDFADPLPARGARVRALPRTRSCPEEHRYTVDSVRSGRFGDAIFLVGADEFAKLPLVEGAERCSRGGAARRRDPAGISGRGPRVDSPEARAA